MIRIRVLNADTVYDYREDCKVTQGIDLFESDEPPLKAKDMTEWWIKQIVANHSCIRSVHFRVVARAPKSVIMQIIRATKGHPQPEVESSRPDWTGKERSNDPYEEKLFTQDHTAESFIEMAKQRLCYRTEKNTRNFMRVIVGALKDSEDPFLRAVGYCSQPACWWLRGCPEIKSCNENATKLSDKLIEAYRLNNNITLRTKQEEIDEALERR